MGVVVGIHRLETVIELVRPGHTTADTGTGGGDGRGNVLLAHRVVPGGVRHPQRFDEALVHDRSEGLAGHGLHHRSQLGVPVAVVAVHFTRDALRGVRQQMANLDLAGLGAADPVASHRVVQTDGTLLDELHEDGGRQRLGHRSEVIGRGRGRRDLGGDVGETEAIRPQELLARTTAADMPGIRSAWRR